jgi:hypothetical protein
MAFVLRACILLVEIVAHGVVMYLSEVRGVHQKQMGYEFAIVKQYLSDKRSLLWGCASFEAFGLGLIVNNTWVVVLSLPGFIFRAAANLTRLYAILTTNDLERFPSEMEIDGKTPTRGATIPSDDSSPPSPTKLHRCVSPVSARWRFMDAFTRGTNESTHSD